MRELVRPDARRVALRSFAPVARRAVALSCVASGLAAAAALGAAPVPDATDAAALAFRLDRTAALTFGQDGSDATAAPAPGDADLAKKLQNPIADLISLPMQLNYDEGFGPKDAGRVQLNVQPVIPFRLNDDWNLISRTIVPIIHLESLADGVDDDTGLGDTLQSVFFSPRDPLGGWIVGAGPVALLPTGTTPGLRSEQLGLGPTAVALRQEHGFTYGALVNHVWSVTDPDENVRVNATFLQPFLSYTWPSATTLAVNTEAGYDWTRGDWTIPINLQVSQLLKLGSQPVQLTLGGRWYAESPDGGAEWGVRFVFTLLFPR